jgi:chitin disaccharide deacetylase
LKRLIINADDFGFTRDVNAGIVVAHREGVLTSATLMANGDAFEDAVRLAHKTPTLDVGCHLVLVQGCSVLDGRLFPESPLRLLFQKFDTYAELRAQIQKILAAGIRPTHLDSHKHTHLLPSVFQAVVRLAKEFSIAYIRRPLPSINYYRRVAHASGVRMTDHLLGFRLTGTLTEDTLAAALERLPDGETEFLCHPGLLGPELAQARTRLKESRPRELEALTSPRIRALISARGIRLGPFPR